MVLLGSLTSLSLSSTGDLPHALPLRVPTFSIEIVEEIIIGFPVKFLLQLRCVCKSWNSLISDPKFARRHRRRFNHHILLVSFFVVGDCPRDMFMSYPLPSVLKALTTGGTQLDISLKYGDLIIGSCDGIICCANFSFKHGHSFVAWNPSIRKFWELAPLEKPLLEDCHRQALNSYGFGYDHLSDTFKLVVIFYYKCCAGGYRTHVMVHTLGSNFWRRIGDFPGIPYHSPGGNQYSASARFVSGALNWLARDTQDIIALDLGKESYQDFLQPDYGIEVHNLTTDIIRDCLCMLANSDVWVMNEYGNNDSWTKLFSFPSNWLHVGFPYYLGYHSLCVLEDDESLFHSHWGLNVYSYKNGTFRSSDLEDKPGFFKDMHAAISNVYVGTESLISPCFRM